MPQYQLSTKYPEVFKARQRLIPSINQISYQQSAVMDKYFSHNISKVMERFN